MKIDKFEYESPELVEVGDFAKVTMGNKTWGWDWRNQCLFLFC